MLVFENPGYSQEKLEAMIKSGYKFDKRTGKELIRALESPRSASKESVKLFEQKINMTLPEEYGDFLLKTNGGIPSLRNFSMSTITYFFLLDCPYRRATLYNNYDVYIGRIPDIAIPVACDDFGNLVLILCQGSRTGAVLFWDHELESEKQPYYGNTTLLAHSFNDFLNSLH